MEIKISFNQPPRQFSFSPSLISLGWEYSVCQFVLHKANVVEKQTACQMLRQNLGFVFEYAFHLDNPEYKYQVPVVIEVKGYPDIKGTLDFYKLEGNTLTVIDTKLVASSVATAIFAGKCPYYELQLMLYAQGLLESNELKGVQPEIDLRLAVCNRNYLNWRFHTFPFDLGRVELAKEWYKALVDASVDTKYLKRLIRAIEVARVHPWIKYSPLGSYMSSDSQLQNKLLSLLGKNE